MLRLIIIASLFVLLLAATPSYQHRVGSAAASLAQCQYLITPAAQSFAARGGAGSLSVLAAGACAWTAASQTPWITLTAANSGTGLGRVNYTVLANTSAPPRTGFINVAGQTFAVTQAGTSAANCTVTTISTGQTINGALTPGDCQSPLRIKDGARPLADSYSFSGSAGQPVIVSLGAADFDAYLYLLDANGAVLAQNDDHGGGSRIPASGGFLLPASGTFIIEVTAFSSGGLGNYALSLTAPAGNCTYALNAPGQAFPANGGTGSVNVNTQAGCTWTAMSNNSWLTATGGGSGPGAVNYTVAANPGVARTGTLAIAGLTFTVTQAGTNGTGCPTVASLNPASGAPGSHVIISGANFTGVTAVSFANNVAAQFTILSDTQIRATTPNNAVTGPLTVGKPTCPDVQTTSFTVQRAVANVSAASYLGAALAAESIVAAFGAGLSTGVNTASSLPLPTSLLGATVKVKDSAGAERLAPLFFVAPTQINYQVPPETAAGAATITVTSGDGGVSLGTMQIAAVAPGLFTANANGQGVPAAVALRVRGDGMQSFEPVARFDQAQNRFVTTPLNLGPASEQVFLLLFGTGLRFNRGLQSVTCKLGGVDAPVSFAGAQGGLVGLDQVNVGVPRALAGRGEVDLVLTVEGGAANTVRVAFAGN